MLVMSVFQTGRESDHAALRLFLVTSVVNEYQSSSWGFKKAAACDKKFLLICGLPQNWHALARPA